MINQQIGTTQLYELHDCYDGEDEAAYPSKVLPEPGDISWAVAYDTETSGLHEDDGAAVSVVSLAFELDGCVHVYAWPFGQGPDGTEKFKIPDDEPDLRMCERISLPLEEWVYLCGWMERCGGLIGHNLKFDLRMMRAGTVNGLEGVVLTHNAYWDTMIASKEMWPHFRGHKLKEDLAVKFFGEDAANEQKALKPYLGPRTDARYDRVPWPVMQPYAQADALYTFWIYEMQQWRKDEGYGGAQWIGREFEVMLALIRMEFAGLPYDPKYSREIDRALAAEQDELVRELPFLPKQAKSWYFTDKLEGSLDRKPLAMTAPSARFPLGQPKLDEEVLRRMVAMGDDKWPHASSLMKFNQLATARKMWYGPYADRTYVDNRLRCDFRHVASGQFDSGGTASGRFSVGRVNLQAIPQDYRIKFDHPSPRAVVTRAVSKLRGWRLWELDLAQAELRVAAMLAGCERMLSAIDEGRDLHGETAKELFKVKPEDEMWDFYRQLAKRGNFSLIFGVGPVTFRQSLAKEGTFLTLTEVKNIVYGWRDLYPEFGHIIEDRSGFATENRHVVLANGRYRRWQEGEQTHKAFNQEVQGSIAEMGKDWLTDSDVRLRPLIERGLNEGVGRGGLILVIHDSQVLLLPDEESERLTTEVQQAGLEIWDRFFPGVPGGIDVKEWKY